MYIEYTFFFLLLIKIDLNFSKEINFLYLTLYLTFKSRTTIIRYIPTYFILRV